MKKFEILFKFAYIGRYLTENTGTAWYLAVQTGTGRYLTDTISDINVYRFLTGTVRYARYQLVRYGIYNYDFITMDYIVSTSYCSGGYPATSCWPSKWHHLIHGCVY